MDAIVNSVNVTIGKYNWAITDVVDAREEGPVPFVFGHLSKFQKEGTITVVDTETKQQEDTEVEDLLVASSPFVYLPQYSGIAYLHVWNDIQEELFTRRFKAIIEATYGNFFVDCSIEPISDYRAFSAKLRELDKITELQAKVHPPNPLFGRVWKPLRDYLKNRNASEVAVKESEESGEGLNTQVVILVEAILEQPDYDPPEPPAIGDSAILMAADGYGMGKVTGTKEEEEVVVRTSDTQKSFQFEKEPNPHELASRANESFKGISDERGLEH